MIVEKKMILPSFHEGNVSENSCFFTPRCQNKAAAHQITQSIGNSEKTSSQFLEDKTK